MSMWFKIIPDHTVLVKQLIHLHEQGTQERHWIFGRLFVSKKFTMSLDCFSGVLQELKGSPLSVLDYRQQLAGQQVICSPPVGLTLQLTLHQRFNEI